MDRGRIVFWKERMVFGEVLDIDLEDRPEQVLTTFGVIDVDKEATLVELKDVSIPWGAVAGASGAILIILNNSWGLVKLIFEIVDYFKDRRKVFYEYLNRFNERN